jgi:hypothetical protein
MKVPRAATLITALLMALVAQSSMALDWSEPWAESHDPKQAASNSDEYAWRLFVALNWPADAVARAADPTAPFGADQPVVWEVWQNAEQVYLEDGADPGPWTAGRRLGGSISGERRFETFSLKDLPNVRHIVGGRMVPLGNAISSAKRLTEIRMNRIAFEYIRSRELYNLDGQLRMITAGHAIEFPAGSIEVKAKWRPIRPDEQGRYHTTRVRFADGTERLYGLTALHIVSKDLPQWFWATFEHVDNPSLPDSDGWRLPSRDRFACAGAEADCNRAPRGIALEGTAWQNYRLRGTLTRFVDEANRPLLLANSELEAGFQGTSSCMTCHARSSLANLGGVATRLPVFDTPGASDFSERRGYIGLPQEAWFNPPHAGGKAAGDKATSGKAAGDPTAGGRPLFQHAGGRPLFQQLDFVWSLSKARPRKVPHET